MIASVHHVAIIASDYLRSRHFYVTILGLKVVQETYRSQRESYKLDLQVGEGVRIELFSFPTPPPRVTGPEACGLRHLAFRVADLDQAIERLRAYRVDVEPVRVDENTGSRFTFFKDPDGLPLELYES
jgi:glyoxylase I family protein